MTGSESAAARRREGYMFVTFDCSLRWPFLLLRFRFLRYRVRAGETMQRTRTRQKSSSFLPSATFVQLVAFRACKGGKTNVRRLLPSIEGTRFQFRLQERMKRDGGNKTLGGKRERCFTNIIASLQYFPEGATMLRQKKIAVCLK